ncbi:astacin, partial [Ancylostoma caninum]
LLEGETEDAFLVYQFQKRSSKVLHYYFDNKIDPNLKTLFEEATKAWEDYSCIDFVEDRNTKSEICVEGQKYEDCLHRGTPGGNQWLTVGCGYFTGVAHEVGHALGLEHTHSRPDRDQYLTVDWNNVEKEFRALYEKEIQRDSQSLIDVYNKTFRRQFEKISGNTNYSGILYDYGSIMHYGASGTNPSMIPKDRNHKRTIGSQAISFADLLEVNKRHNCEEKCLSDERAVQCEYQGFPNPKNCSACVCPSGYGGRSCGDKPGECGQHVIASDDWQTLEESIQSPKNTSRYVTCTSWIRVEVENNPTEASFKEENRLVGLYRCDVTVNDPQKGSVVHM